MHYSFFPPVILIDHTLSTISLSAFETDSGSGVSRLTLMSLSSSIEMHYSFVPPVILIDHVLSTISPSAFETDSRCGASRLTLMNHLTYYHNSPTHLMQFLVEILLLLSYGPPLPKRQTMVLHCLHIKPR
jgi:hypothetical protein